MSKFKLSLMLIMVSVISIPAMAGEAVVKRVPAGAVAFHFVFDLSYVPVPPEFVGYIAFIEGVDSPLFTATPSKDTAYFTVRVSKYLPPPTPLPVEQDPALNAQIIMPGGQFTVYYNANPGPRDWNNPASFSDGVPIAVFEESALLNTEAWGNGFPGTYFSKFSGRLIDSTPIMFKGQKIDFKKMVPNGVTGTNFGNAIRFLPDGRPGASGGGTAVAIGGDLRDK